MAKAANNILIVFIMFFCFGFASVCAEVIKSPVNQKRMETSPAKGSYAFLAAGHLYGAPENQRSLFPSSSLLGKIKEINEIDHEFFVSLGDNFRIADKRNIDNFKESFASRLKAPLFIAVGNHDVTSRELYEKNFGKTYYYFIYGQELYIILDTELGSGSIKGLQLDFLLNVLNEARNNRSIKNILIFSHRLIWSVNNPAFKIVYDHLNSTAGYAKNNDYSSGIMPVLSSIAKSKAVYWISGDIGCSWSLSLFYEKDLSTNITYIATGLGDTNRDAIIKVNISEGAVSFAPISLTGEEVQPIEYYGTDYWKAHFSVANIGYSYSVVKKKISSLLHHKYYWIGIITGIIVIMPVAFCRRKKGVK